MAFLRQARPTPGLSPAEVASIARRLRRSHRGVGRRALWPAVATLGLVLITGATLAVAKVGWRGLPIVGPLLEPLLGAPPVPAPRKPSPRPSRAARPAVEQPSATTAMPAAPPIAPEASAFSAPPMPSMGATAQAPVARAALGLGDGAAPPRAMRSSASTASPSLPVRHTAEPRRNLALHSPASSPKHELAAPAVVAPSARAEEHNPLVAESRSLASLIGAWHNTRDARKTLHMLDAHEQRFPDGHMRLEARVLRAELHLAAGREPEALAVLDTLSLSRIPRSRELQVVRGELRIKQGRCADGKRDLDEVLERGTSDAFATRAVRALARCP